MKIQKGRIQENGGEKAESLQLDKDVTFILCFVHENNYIMNFNFIGNRRKSISNIKLSSPWPSFLPWCSVLTA